MGRAMKYDDASWHYGAQDFPSELAPEAGGTHIGMFVTWAILNGLAGSIHTEDSPVLLGKLQRREITPGAWFMAACDEKFTDEDLTEDGIAFAQIYYADGDGLKIAQPSFIADYEAAFPQQSDLHQVPDTWAVYDMIAPTISRRFMKWRNTGKGWRRLIPGLG